MSQRQAAEMLPLVIADIYEAAGALRRRGDQIAAVAEQTQARWQLLSVLSEGDWTVPKIARRLGVTRQAVQRTADQLRADRMIEFEANPDHERSPLARPTPAGRAALAAIITAASDWNELAATGLAEDDLEVARAGAAGAQHRSTQRLTRQRALQAKAIASHRVRPRPLRTNPIAQQTSGAVPVAARKQNGATPKHPA